MASTRSFRQGQVEFGVIENNGVEYTAFGASVCGREITAYLKFKRSHYWLTTWRGETMIDYNDTAEPKWKLAEDRKFDAEVVATFEAKAGDWFGVSEAEWKFLAEKVLVEQGQRFVDDAARRELGRFLVRKTRPRGLAALRQSSIP